MRLNADGVSEGVTAIKQDFRGEVNTIIRELDTQNGDVANLCSQPGQRISTVRGIF